MTNTASDSRPLAVRLAIEPAEKLALANGLILATGTAKRGQKPYPEPRCRLGVTQPDQTALSIEHDTTLLCTGQLDAGKSRGRNDGPARPASWDGRPNGAKISWSLRT